MEASPISPQNVAIPADSSTAAATQSVSAHAAATGAEAAEDGATSVFGALLANQIKGKAAALKGMPLSDDTAAPAKKGGAAAKDSAQSGAALAPTDLSALVAPLLPAVAAAQPAPDVTQPSTALPVAGAAQPVADAGLAVAALPAASAPQLALQVDAKMVQDAKDVKDIKDAKAARDVKDAKPGNGVAAALAAADKPASAENVLQQAPAAAGSAKAADFAADGKILPQALPVKELKGLPEIAPQTAAAAPDTHQVRTDVPLPALPVAAAPQPVNQVVSTPVGAPGWDAALGQKVVWMATQQQQVADLHLNPPNLGPVEIRLTLSSDNASAMFVSPHAAVRDAIESALPRLREMLADNGLTLGNVTVSSQSFSQQQGGHGAGDQARQFSSAGLMSFSAGLPVSQGMVRLPAARDGLVDTFA